MRALNLTATVTPDHTLSASIPADIAPGSHRVVVLLPDESPSSGRPTIGSLPVLDAGLLDPANTFRRENMYGLDGR
jgi:hypothetical protein